MSHNKTQGEILSEQLLLQQKNAWEKISDEEFKIAFELSERYKNFLNKAKTEREFTAEAEQLAKSKGYVAFDEVIKSNKKLQPGMKVYSVGRNKTIALAVIGQEAMEKGINIVGAHIDSPRIDLKPNPMYEANDMVFLKTHYYGGIKKYQWVTIPLAMHGVIVKRDGSTVNVCIGEDDNDTVFTITDLLPHLAAEQMQKKMSEAITGEGLNILSGSIPYKDDKVKDKVKLNVLKILNEKYGIVEEDFLSAELELVPKFAAVDVGFDKSMVGSYGQDDRVCAYAALEAILEVNTSNRTAACILYDKEEIGSMGNTGAQSSFFVNFLAQLCSMSTDKYSDIVLRNCLSNSRMLSADVNAAIDPTYESAYDKRNSSFLGRGVVIQKYTGARGKSGASDASAEFVGEIRKLFNDNNIVWQGAELGKVDQGGGGTIAEFIANLNVDVVDCGVAILSMHSPFEVTSKVDIFMSYKAYKTFLIS